MMGLQVRVLYATIYLSKTLKNRRILLDSEPLATDPVHPNPPPSGALGSGIIPGQPTEGIKIKPRDFR